MAGAALGARAAVVGGAALATPAGALAAGALAAGALAAGVLAAGTVALANVTFGACSAVLGAGCAALVARGSGFGASVGVCGAPINAASAPPTPPTTMPMPVVQRMPFKQRALAEPGALADRAYDP